MENNFYRDDFENFLKDNADDFRMVPSRRVWYSIYNNMHPDRRWPSVAVCLLILTAVLYIGVSNNNSLSESARRSNENMMASATDQSQPGIAELPKHNSLSRIQKIRERIGTVNLPGVANDYDNMPADLDISYVRQSADAFTNDDEDNDGIIGRNNNTYTIPGKTSIAVTAGSAEEDQATALKKNSRLNATPDIAFPETDNSIKSATAAVEKQKESELQKKAPDPNKPWVEDYAFRNKPKTQPGKQRFSLEYYVTPSFGYRAFYKNDQSKNPALIPNANLKDAAALNLEAGASLMYKASDHLRLKGGLQVNYTNYISKVTSLDHPMQANLASRSADAVRYSDYAVNEGISRLNKTTLQLSVPVGADIKILGSNKFKWYLGATIQPTYVINGSSYVLSQDAKNYISETPLLRRWNVNTSVETFVSFKPSTGISVNIGPQFRYQLLSTYKKEYNYSEKLYNVGVKVGIVTNF